MEHRNRANDLQKACLEIMKEIHRVCDENNIEYSLTGGSVIGSYLFKGFIPWDDDIDIMMTRENYEKFIRIFPKKSRKKYEIINYNTSDNIHVLYSKVHDVTTTLVEKFGDTYIKSGVFVDITVMDYVPNKWRHMISIILQRYMEVYLYKSMDANHTNKLKQVLYNFIYNKKIGKNCKKLYGYFDNFCKNAQKSKQCAELLSLNLGRILYPTDLFKSYKLMPFEDTQFYVVECYMDYLYFRYGRREFSKEPPPGEIHYHQVYYNLSLGYNEFDLNKYIKTEIKSL